LIASRRLRARSRMTTWRRKLNAPCARVCRL